MFNWIDRWNDEERKEEVADGGGKEVFIRLATDSTYLPDTEVQLKLGYKVCTLQQIGCTLRKSYYYLQAQ